MSVVQKTSIHHATRPAIGPYPSATLDFLRTVVALCRTVDPVLATQLATALGIGHDAGQPNVGPAEDVAERLMTALRMLVHLARDVDDTAVAGILACIRLLSRYLEALGGARSRLH